MESLNTLANSLPTAYQNAEKDLLNNFKAAALSITTLYRSARQNSKHAYNAGYAAACQDLLTMIQQGVSLDASASSHDPEQDGMTIGRVMDWIEARLEAVRSRDEEEEEEEERERERSRPGAAIAEPRAQTQASSTACSADQNQARLPSATSSSRTTRSNEQAAGGPSSSSPTPSPSQHRPIARSIRTRASTKAEPSIPLVPPPLPSSPPSSDISNSSDVGGAPPHPPAASLSAPTNAPSANQLAEIGIPLPLTAGAKRRHAMMMMLDAAGAAPPPVAAIDGSSAGVAGLGAPPLGIYAAQTQHHAHVPGALAGRRRTRGGARGFAQQSQNVNIAPDAMDVEEDGRERKRVARR